MAGGQAGRRVGWWTGRQVSGQAGWLVGGRRTFEQAGRQVGGKWVSGQAGGWVGMQAVFEINVFSDTESHIFLVNY